MLADTPGNPPVSRHGTPMTSVPTTASCLPIRRALAATVWAGAALMAGCGGGGSGSSAEPAATSAGPAAAPAATDEALTQGLASRSAPGVQTLSIRARGVLAGNVGPLMEVRVGGATVATLEVRSTESLDYNISTSRLVAGAQVDIAFRNVAVIGGVQRNLVVDSVSDGTVVVIPSQPDVRFDVGSGAEAFDGINVQAGRSIFWGNGALRFSWPDPSLFVVSARDSASARFLQQATFGPTMADIERLRSISFSDWINAQIALPAAPEVLTHVQAKMNLGPDYLPVTGSKYSPDWVGQKFWAGAASSPDQLRKRVALALQEIFVVSQSESNLYYLNRAYANYIDNLNRQAFGNFRQLIEDVALTPVMGIYLSHMRNRKEDMATNRQPDENFARELMQLFTIGLYELNQDGSLKLNAQGQPVETYSNADVMALARVFTGWSWGFDDAQLTEANFLWRTPDLKERSPLAVDVRRMKPYPGVGSQTEKRLLAGRAAAATVPVSASPEDSVRIALDSLFNHPNVGPFIGKQLIQRLVTSNPSPAYISRVAQAFNDNGRGVRGDLAAVVRAILLDTEARSAPTPGFGKIRQPVLRVSHWMRAFNARSASGEFLLTDETQKLGQRVHQSPSVFNFYRPGYVPANTAVATAGMGAPEMQIVDEASTAHWVNMLELMLSQGLGWHGSQVDVTTPLAAETAWTTTSVSLLLSRLDVLLFAGRMSPALRKNIVQAMLGVPEDADRQDLARTRVAIYIAMSSPEYLVQR